MSWMHAHVPTYLFLTFGFSIALNSEVMSRVNHVGVGYSAREIFLNKVGRFGSSNGKFPAKITYSKTPAYVEVRRIMLLVLAEQLAPSFACKVLILRAPQWPDLCPSVAGLVSGLMQTARNVSCLHLLDQ